MSDMKNRGSIPQWAEYFGVSYITFLRACQRIGINGIGQRGARSITLTLEQAEEARAAIIRGKGGVKLPPEVMAYETTRQGFLDTWSVALATEEDLDTFTKALQVYGVICAAKNRDNLDIELNGWRVGDIFLEVAQGLDVDRIEGGGFGGFTAWLQEQGYQSPGWNVI